MFSARIGQRRQRVASRQRYGRQESHGYGCRHLSAQGAFAADGRPNRASVNKKTARQSRIIKSLSFIRGIFVVSKNPKALAAWYRDVLGISLEPWGGATFRCDAAGHPAVAAWNAFPEGESYLAPSRRDFMLDFAVDDLDVLSLVRRQRASRSSNVTPIRTANSRGFSIPTARKSSYGRRRRDDLSHPTA